MIPNATDRSEMNGQMIMGEIVIDIQKSPGCLGQFSIIISCCPTVKGARVILGIRQPAMLHRDKLYPEERDNENNLKQMDRATRAHAGSIFLNPNSWN